MLKIVIFIMLSSGLRVVVLEKFCKILFRNLLIKLFLCIGGSFVGGRFVYINFFVVLSVVLFSKRY